MTAPTWFLVIGVILLVIYIIFRFLGSVITNIIGVLLGGGSGCGCLLKSIVGILAVILLIWYIVTDLL